MMRLLFMMFLASMLHICVVRAGEPIVVLTYGDSRETGSKLDEYGTHRMRSDPNAHQMHQVAEAETLSHIMAEYYGGSGLNMKFVELAILQFNREAFVRGNPNFLFAGKLLHLPSVNQIKGLVTGQKSKSQRSPSNRNQNEIFFFGG
ncbi:pilus assembly protein FimV [Alphaproteobacteria bacterium]|nr:pilus assembly protein FimV [Alphaproteobacteria bacterium]